MTTKPKKTESAKSNKKQPDLKLVPIVQKKAEPPAAEKMMAKQLESQLKKTKVKEKPSEGALASQAMEYADQALAYADFTRKIRSGEQVDGGLVASALRYAMVEAAKEAAEAFEPLSPEVRMAEREKLMMGDHLYADLYRTAVKTVNDLRSRLALPLPPQRINDRLDLVLGAASKAAAEKFAQRGLHSAELWAFAEWAKSKTTANAEPTKQSENLFALASFLSNKGQKVKADALVQQAVEASKQEAAAEPPKPPEMDLSKLSKSEADLINFVKNAGGSVTTDAIKQGFASGKWSIKDMSRMMDQKALSTPRDGVVRLDESKLMPPAVPPKEKAFGDGKQGPPRKSHAVKLTKEQKEEMRCKLTPGCCLIKDHPADVPCQVKAPRPSGTNKPIVNPEGRCLCGCGQEVKQTSRFGIGHDAKLHSAVLKAAKGDKAILAALPLKNETTAAYLKQAPWMTPEVLKAIGL